ncbi:MAG TPA: metallophosphoesterase [Prolixibacteraceae bacterium]|nr:metallophosphoesterase [Prolixibacteraceae bacterium]
MRKLFFLLITALLLLSSCSKKEPILKIGLVADPQYANKPSVGERYYRESLWKLEEAMDTFNYNNVNFVQSLGDIIDTKWESFDSILPIYDKLSTDIENYHLLGNHDYDIDSTHLRGLLKKLSMPDYYYSYTKKGWRFLVLDATDYSYYSNLLHHHDINQVDFYYENTNGKINQNLWNSAIGENQQNWIKQELDSAKLLNQKVILFSHLPVRPKNDPHNLWNDDEIIELIENNSNVVAFINGHNHLGGYEFKNGIHYITVFGMVNTMISSYGILELYKNSLVLRGYGNQKTLYLDNE